MNHPIYTRIFEGLGYAKPPIHQASHISQVKDQIRYRSLEEIIGEEIEEHGRLIYVNCTLREEPKNPRDIVGIWESLATMIIAARIGHVCELPNHGEEASPQTQELWSLYFPE